MMRSAISRLLHARMVDSLRRTNRNLFSYRIEYSCTGAIMMSTFASHLKHSFRACGFSALTVLSIGTLAASTLSAQDPQPPSSLPTANIPVKQLGPVQATSSITFNNVSSLRALPDGGLFVNDNAKRQIVKLDGNLKEISVVADTSGAPLPYSQRSAGMMPYMGDSTIIVDPGTLSFLVLNTQGKLVHVMAPPRISDINQIANASLGTNAFDSKGRLVYRGSNAGGGFGGFGGGRGGDGGGRGGFGGGGAPAPAAPAAAKPNNSNPLNQPDSLPILRADFDTRMADTAAWVRVPRTDIRMSTSEDGSTRMTAMINPLPQGDDWALLSDGTIAIVRVLDYHVDFVSPSGAVTSSDKLPFDWKRISDEEKATLIDSLKATSKAATERAAAQANGGGGGRFRMQFEPVAAERLPDYVPPIRPGTSLADHDGNLWILPMTSNIAAQIAQQLGGAGGPGGGRGGFPGAFGGGRGDAGGAGAGGGRGAGDASGAARGAGAGDTGGARRQGQGADTAGARRAGADSSAARRAMPDSSATAALASRAQPQFQLVYDVVNRQGQLVERVKLPPNRTILGFGPGGVVYLGAREGRTMTIEKVSRPN